MDEYVPRVGDRVYVLVDTDFFGDRMDATREYIVESANYDDFVMLRLPEHEKLNGSEWWSVEHNQITPSIRDTLAHKMDERTRLDTEIAELERQLEAGAR